MIKKTLFADLIACFCLIFSLSVRVLASDEQTASEVRHRLAKAEMERTQFFWQPLAEKSAVVALIGASIREYKSLQGSETVNVFDSGSTSAFYYSYGISKLWAMIATISSSPKQTRTTAPSGVSATSTGGPDDIVVGFKNTTPFHRWNLHYGLSLNLSLDINRPARSGAQGNNYSGGDGATSYIGSSFNIFGKGFSGLRVQYQYKGAKIVDVDGNILDAQQRTGGDVASTSAFFEWHAFPWLFDLRGQWVLVTPQNTSSVSFNGAVDGFTSFSEALGFQYFLSSHDMIRLEGTLSQLPRLQGTGFVQDKSLSSSVGLSYRDEF